MDQDKAAAEAVKSRQVDPALPGHSAVPQPAAVNERADALDESTDGDGVARFDVARDPGAA